jgi:hypothetical protein
MEVPPEEAEATAVMAEALAEPAVLEARLL